MSTTHFGKTDIEIVLDFVVKPCIIKLLIRHRKANIMGLETKALHQIDKAFNEVGASTPNMYWQYGTLWIETEDKNELELVKQAMIEDVLDPKFTVQFSEMKPTEREPWTEWAMDVVEKKEQHVLA